MAVIVQFPGSSLSPPPREVTDDKTDLLSTIISWNIRGLGTFIRDEGIEAILSSYPNVSVLCFQEILMQKADRIQQLIAPYKEAGFHIVLNPSANQRYKSGTMVMTRETPLSTSTSFPGDTLSDEGRVITVELCDSYIINVYAPASSSRDRLKTKAEWWTRLCQYLNNLQKKKQIIVCGDLNAVSTKQDIGAILPHSPGCYTEERQMIRDMISQLQLVDAYRYMNPDSISFSWVRNHDFPHVGLRIDYCLVPQHCKSQIQQCIIDDRLFMSDHYPMLLELLRT